MSDLLVRALRQRLLLQANAKQFNALRECLLDQTTFEVLWNASGDDGHAARYDLYRHWRAVSEALGDDIGETFLQRAEAQGRAALHTLTTVHQQIELERVADFFCVQAQQQRNQAVVANSRYRISEDGFPLSLLDIVDDDRHADDVAVTTAQSQGNDTLRAIVVFTQSPLQRSPVFAWQPPSPDLRATPSAQRRRNARLTWQCRCVVARNATTTD